MDEKLNYFQNKGNPVPDSTISEIVDHPGGKWGPEGDSTQVRKPDENLKGE